jgi:hypothetical protein
MIEVTTIFGIPDATVHALVVELHTGMAVFAFLALVVMVVTDVLVRGKPLTERVKVIRADADAIAYLGALGAVFFLVLSGITGYLIESYSVLSTTPILLNKSIFALGALYFWVAYVFIRFWFGPRLWRKQGLYVLTFVTSIFAILFTSLAGSIGGELSPYGQSVMDPLYTALGISWRTLTLTQDDVYLTAGVMVVVIVIVGALSLLWKESNPPPNTPAATPE